MVKLKNIENIEFKYPATLLLKDRTLVQIKTLASLDDVLFGHTYDSESIKPIEDAGFYTKIIPAEKQHILIGRFKFHPDMKEAWSSGSDSKYLLWNESRVRSHGFLVQYLPPHSKTSFHHHEKQMEIFHVLYGTSMMRTGNGILPYSAGASLLVPPKTPHQLTTGDECAINVIEIHNVDYKDHVNHE